MGRFQVMAILQYARFRRLGYSVIESQSLGLAFALFYAMMKNRHWYRNKKQTYKKQKIVSYIQKEQDMYVFGLKMFYIKHGKDKIFKMAGKICDQQAWTYKIASKFKNMAIYNKAIAKANKLISQADINILENNNRFFNKVYKPVRDNFVENLINELTIA